ncbi:hypothetical protein [Dyella sp.]|uniref:hypothetical protein n=1 Tax=Dyella sp. TaxID=1869338 RepID=UPI002ED1DD6D
MKKMFFPVAAALLIVGCSGGSADFSIDNPTDASLKLQIDDASYDIPAHQAKAISLKAGEHTMDAPATGKIKFIVYANRKGGMINPTLGDYVIVSETYVTDESKLKNFRPMGAGPFKLDGVEFDGPFQRVNGLFVDKDWRFGVREPFPASLEGYDAGNGGNIFRKIFAAPDFVNYYEEQTQQKGVFEKNRLHESPVRPALQVADELPQFADAQLQADSQPLRKTLESYRHAADPVEQKKLQEQYQKQLLDFVSAFSARVGSMPVEENEKYNTFIRQMGDAMGHSVYVES